ncbi:MAG: hypothetical protein RL141_590 [Candidatus Parcubacteria bacterium]|jgi:hypothetical protein
MKMLSPKAVSFLATATILTTALMPLSTRAAFYTDAVESLEYYDNVLETWQDFEELEEDTELEAQVGFRVWVPDYTDCSGSSPYTFSFDVAGENVNGLGPAQPVLSIPGGAPGYVTWEFDPDDYFEQAYEIQNVVLKCQAGENSYNGINDWKSFILVGHDTNGLIPWLLQLLGWVF